jgi:hypothetical protein
VESRLAETQGDSTAREESRTAATILSLSVALQSHDRRTRGHAERVRVFTDLLGEELQLPEADRYRLRWAALMHDIGKLTISPSILNKPGSLDDREWRLMKGHPLEGARIAEPIMEWLGPWGDAIVEHHERFDGKGYPNGLAYGAISLGGRIVSVADSYDTMTAARSYKKPMAVWAARRELADCAGGQFDPEIVRAFLSISLPKLLWRTGPVSLFVQLPFLARLQEVGLSSVTAMTQGVAAATVAAGVTAMVVAGSTGASAHGHHHAQAHGDHAASLRRRRGRRRARRAVGRGRRRARQRRDNALHRTAPPRRRSPSRVPSRSTTPERQPPPRRHRSDTAPIPAATPVRARTLPGLPPLPLPSLPPLPLPSLPPLPLPSLPPLPLPIPLALHPTDAGDHGEGILLG